MKKGQVVKVLDSLIIFVATIVIFGGLVVVADIVYR